MTPATFSIAVANQPVIFHAFSRHPAPPFSYTPNPNLNDSLLQHHLYAHHRCYRRPGSGWSHCDRRRSLVGARVREIVVWTGEANDNKRGDRATRPGSVSSTRRMQWIDTKKSLPRHVISTKKRVRRSATENGSYCCSTTSFIFLATACARAKTIKDFLFLSFFSLFFCFAATIVNAASSTDDRPSNCENFLDKREIKIQSNGLITTKKKKKKEKRRVGRWRG